jgi:hypothetical protein
MSLAQAREDSMAAQTQAWIDICMVVHKAVMAQATTPQP